MKTKPTAYACKRPSSVSRAIAWTGRMAVFAVTLAATAANAQVLWEKAALGMSQADLVKVVPGGKLGLKKGDCGVSVDNAKVGGAPFNICYLFMPDTLARVLMRQPDEYLANASTKKAFGEVSAELARRYGKEDIVKPLESRHAGLFGESVWYQGKTKIELSVTPTTQMTSGLVIFITAR